MYSASCCFCSKVFRYSCRLSLLPSSSGIFILVGIPPNQVPRINLSWQVISVGAPLNQTPRMDLSWWRWSGDPLNQGPRLNLSRHISWNNLEEEEKNLQGHGLEGQKCPRMLYFKDQNKHFVRVVIFVAIPGSRFKRRLKAGKSHVLHVSVKTLWMIKEIANRSNMSEFVLEN